MQCPICSVELIMSERQGIEIDYCPKWRGVWLDRGELDKIIKKSGASQAEMQKMHQAYHGHDDRYESHQGHFKRKKSFFEELFD